MFMLTDLFSATRSVTTVAGVRPKQMLNKRMKSFSLDTPDAPKPVDQSTKLKSSSYTNSNCIAGKSSFPTHFLF